MMAIVLPDARFEMPELFIPYRTPVGPVAIDHNHSLARDIAAFVLVVNGHPIDLVKRKPTDEWIGATGRDGKYGLYGAHNDDGYLAGKISLAAECTILGLQFHTDNGQDHTLFNKLSASDADQDLLLWLDTSGSAVRAAVSAGSAIYNSTSVATNTWTLWGANLESYVSADIFIDGELALEGGSPSTWSFTPCDWYIGTNAGGDKGSIGGIKFVVVWNRQLSVSEHRSFYNNPYKFLVPA